MPAYHLSYIIIDFLTGRLIVGVSVIVTDSAPYSVLSDLYSSLYRECAMSVDYSPVGLDYPDPVCGCIDGRCSGCFASDTHILSMVAIVTSPPIGDVTLVDVSFATRASDVV